MVLHFLVVLVLLVVPTPSLMSGYCPINLRINVAVLICEDAVTAMRLASVVA